MIDEFSRMLYKGGEAWTVGEANSHWCEWVVRRMSFADWLYNLAMFAFLASYFQFGILWL